MPYTFKLMHQYMYSLGGINLKLLSSAQQSTEIDIDESQNDIETDEYEEQPPMTTMLGEILEEAYNPTEVDNYNDEHDEEYSF